MTETIEGARPAASAVRTFLIADVRGYTHFTVEHGDEAAAQLAGQFAAIAQEIASAHEGEVIELRGDEALAVFTSARQALRAATALQQRYAAETMAGTALPLKVGIGLDAGEAVPVERGYRGAALNLASRLCSLAGPGKVLASQEVVHLARKLEGLTYTERGEVQLKGFTDPVRVVQVVSGAVGEPAAGSEAPESTRVPPLPIGGFLGALPTGPLVARDAELHKVLSIVDAVSGGSGRLVFLAGEPGIGKTRLAQEIALQLRDRGFSVASGRCYEPQEAVPFYPFLEALGTLSTTAPSSVRTEIARRWPYLLGLLPNLNAPAPSSSTVGKEDQERLYWSVTGFVQAIAQEVPVALLLDDLHWPDGTSLDLLQHLARHTRAYPVLLLGIYRDVEVGRQHPLRRVLRDLHREHLAERLEIRRLEQDGTLALIAATLGEAEDMQELAELLQRYTEGNPFFVQEALRALEERGDVYRYNGAWSHRTVTELVIPESVRDAIGERLSRLSDAAQELLRVASALGQTFSFDDLQELDGRSEGELEEALEEAVSSGLIREQGRDGYSFNHALSHQVLYAELPVRRKRRLHQEAGEALERRPEQHRRGREAELARHFLEADDLERALRHSLRAGDEAAEVFAHSEAEQHYRTAVGLAREGGDAVHEAEALEQLGWVWWTVGRYDQALDAPDRAAELQHGAGDSAAEGQIAAKTGWALSQVGRPEEGIARLQALTERLEAQGPSPALVELYTALVHLFVRQGRAQDVVTAAERASELAQLLGDDRMRVQGELNREMALQSLDRFDEALHVLEDLIPAAEAVGESETLGRALVHATAICAAQGAFERSRRYGERLLDVRQRTSSPDRVANALTLLGDLLRLQGDWTEARAHFDRAAELTASLGSFQAGWVRLSLARLSLLEGKWQEATAYLEACERIVERTGDRNSVPRLEALRAERALWQGHADAAVARLEPLLERFEPDHEELMVLTEAALAVGDALRASSVLSDGLERAARQGNRVALVDWKRLEGALLGAQRRWEEAEQALSEAASLASDLPYPFGRARALYEWGRLCIERGAVVQARERLEEALAVFRRLGAEPYVERTQGRLDETRF